MKLTTRHLLALTAIFLLILAAAFLSRRLSEPLRGPGEAPEENGPEP